MVNKMKLVKELNENHAELGAILAAIGTEPALTENARGLLKKLRHVLTDHLSREDRDFYPAMREAAKARPALENVLTVMGKEMESLSVRVVSSLDSWIRGENAPGFPKAFADLREILTERIRREERELYAKYLKLP